MIPDAASGIQLTSKRFGFIQSRSAFFFPDFLFEQF